MKKRRPNYSVFRANHGYLVHLCREGKWLALCNFDPHAKHHIDSTFDGNFKKPYRRYCDKCKKKWQSLYPSPENSSSESSEGGDQ